MLTGGFYAEIDLELRRRDRPGEERPAVLASPRCARSSCRSATCWTRLHEGRSAVHDRRVEGVLAPQRRPGAVQALAPRAPGRAARCAWSRSSRATTTWSSSAHAAPARATCSSRSRPTPTSSRRQGDRRPDVRQQSRPASAAWSASTTWSASTRCPASPSTRRTASTS